MGKLHLLVGLGFVGCATALSAAEDDKTPGQRALETLDTNGDGAVSFAEFQESGRNVLAAIDSDGNGVLTLDEFLTARPAGPRGFGNRGPRRGNGQGAGGGVEINEERREAMRARMRERATEQFQAMDLDGDEILTADEYQEASFNRLDRDGNGELSADELRRRGRGGPGRRGGPGGQRGGQSPQA